MPNFDEVPTGFQAVAASGLSMTGAALGVGWDANGEIVAGAGVSGVIGVALGVSTWGGTAKAQVLTAGWLPSQYTPAFAAGAVVYANNTTGALSTSPTGATRVGGMVAFGKGSPLVLLKV